METLDQSIFDNEPKTEALDNVFKDKAIEAYLENEISSSDAQEDVSGTNKDKVYAEKNSFNFSQNSNNASIFSPEAYFLMGSSDNQSKKLDKSSEKTAENDEINRKRPSTPKIESIKESFEKQGSVEKNSSSRFALKIHLRKSHQSNTQNKCLICLRDFSSVSNLNLHIRSIHEGKKNRKTFFLCK